MGDLRPLEVLCHPLLPIQIYITIAISCLLGVPTISTFIPRLPDRHRTTEFRG